MVGNPKNSGFLHYSCLSLLPFEKQEHRIYFDEIIFQYLDIFRFISLWQYDYLGRRQNTECYLFFRKKYVVFNSNSISVQLR